MQAAARVAENEPVLLEALDKGVLRLTLNRPAQRNALSVELMTALGQALDRAAADRNARVVVIAGAGEALCAAHDLRELRGVPPDNRRRVYQAVNRQVSAQVVLNKLYKKPVIAEIFGV